LRQIPATVIDTGVMRHVPYQSYRCGEDYELNVYGDPDDPAGIEIGIYRALLGSDAAKRNCVQFVAGLMRDAADATAVRSVDLAKGSVTRDGLTIEVTPSTAEDAYGGWWVSVYEERKLDAVRATPKELDAITVAKAEAPVEPKQESAPPPAGTPSPAPVRERTSSPNEPRGASAEDEVDVLTRWSASDLRNARPRTSPAPARPTVPRTTGGSGVGTSGSGGDRVYVRGYYRNDGTYVRGHTRSRARR
jgi:hypothetical protein